MLRLMQLENRENPSGPSLVDPTAPLTPPPPAGPPVQTPPAPPPATPPAPPSGGEVPGIDLINPLNIGSP